MPFVFVHGVATRSGEDYERERELRDAFLKEVVAPVVGISPSHPVLSPYWGSEGIRFWKGLNVVPTGKGLETFGAAEEAPPSLGIAIAENRAKSGDTVESIAQRDPELAIDMLWDVAITTADSPEDFRELARAYGEAQKKLAEDTSKQWLANTDAKDLADDVFQKVRPPSTRTFGKTGLFSLLDEAGKRLALTVPDILSHGAVALGRRPLTRKIATFIGDAFRYLEERGDGTKPGPIASKVIDDLKIASQQAKRTSEPLIVICHSFGGEIVYDVLTHYAKDIDVDVWVTVGSQVGLFEEMSLLWISPRRLKPSVTVDNEAIPSPERVKRWINIVDGNDVLGFLVLPVFTGDKHSVVEEFKYDTGYPVTGAHSGYFKWPSFYKRLAHRLS